jgi:hypothetical protein
MAFIKRARVRAGLLAAAPIVLLGALGVVPASAAADTTAPTAARALLEAAMAETPALPTDLPAGTTLAKHNCVVIHRTSDATLQSVTCADLWFFDDGGNSKVWGGNEVLCESLSGNLADCSDPTIGYIKESAGLESDEFPTRPESGACGQVLGHSDCGTRRVENITGDFDEASDFGGTTCHYTGTSVATVEMSDGIATEASVQTTLFSHPC